MSSRLETRDAVRKRAVTKRTERRLSTRPRFIELPPSDYKVVQGGGDASRAGRSVARRVGDLIATSIKEFRINEELSRENRWMMLDDYRFKVGQQWTPEDRDIREGDDRPCLTVNRIPQFIRQVANSMRINRTTITFAPFGGGASRDKANALEAVARSIDANSDSDVAWSTAIDHQLTMGLGWVRLTAEWDGVESWTQSCRVRRVRDPLSVYPDMSAVEADRSDMRVLHIVHVMSGDDFTRQFGLQPSAESIEIAANSQTGRTASMSGQRVIVFERYWLEDVDAVLCKMSDDSSVWETELAKHTELFLAEHRDDGAEPPTVVRRRKVKKTILKWCMHTTQRLLEGNDALDDGRVLPGDRIPLIPVIGDESFLDGAVDIRGMVRDAKDPARMANFWASSVAEYVALTPKAPWVAAAGQIERYLEQWNAANQTPQSALRYDPMAVGGMLVPPPERTQMEISGIQGLSMGLSMSHQDLMAVMGLYEPSLGQSRSPSESGRARESLQKQGDLANSNYQDSVQWAKRSLGRLLLKWIPVVYDVARLMHLEGGDAAVEEAVVYTGAHNAPKPGEFKNGNGEAITAIYDLDGIYDVAVVTGPNVRTQREQTVAWLLDLFKVFPPLAEIGADVLLEYSDSPAAQILAARAKKMLPAQFQEDKGGENDPQALSQKLAQSQQQLQQMGQAMQEMATIIKEKVVDTQAKRDVAIIAANAAENVARMRFGSTLLQQQAAIEAQRTDAAAAHVREVALKGMDVEAAMLQQVADQLHASASQAADQQHEGQMTAMGQSHEAGMQAGQQVHEQQMTAAQQQQALEAEQAAAAEEGATE